MTRTSVHALLLFILLLAATVAGAALPQDRPFYATIKNSSSGHELCLAFGLTGKDTFPSRTTFGAGPYCGFRSLDELFAKRHAVWRLLPLGDGLYTIRNAAADGERCLIFGGNGSDRFPSRHNWNAGEYCGLPGGRRALLANKQAVFRIADLGGDLYTITNASGDGERCLIFGGRGRDEHPSRFNWGNGPYCGFPGGKEALIANKQAIFKIEPVGNTDILDHLFSYLYKGDGRESLGITYSLTTDNLLTGKWVVHTPHVWGKAAADVPDGAGRFVTHHITELIASAQQHVDLTTLTPFPTGEFETAIRRGLERLATKGDPVTIRILGGWDPTNIHGTNQGDYLRSLIVDIKDRTRYPNNKLQISVASQRTHSISWNHAKILAVDGKEMLIGGQNFWDSDYLRQNPAHDISVRLQGSSTVLGHRYADAVWADACSYIDPRWKPALWKAGGEVTTGCLPNPSLNMPAPAGNVRALMVGRLGLGRFFKAEASELAMWEAFEKTSGHILIAQQDFMGTIFWNWYNPIIAAVLKGRPVTLIVGDDHAKAGPPPGTTYKFPLQTMDVLAHSLFTEARNQAPSMPIGELKKRLCSTLDLAPMRFGPSKKWPSGFNFANHSKFWMIDSLFYVGSHNLYPAGLWELGIIVNDAQHAATMKKEYWDEIWSWSKRDAVSGGSAANCIFQPML